MNFWTGLLIGTILGSNLGLLVLALLRASSDGRRAGRFAPAPPSFRDRSRAHPKPRIHPNGGRHA